MLAFSLEMISHLVLRVLGRNRYYVVPACSPKCHVQCSSPAPVVFVDLSPNLRRNEHNFVPETTPVLVLTTWVDAGACSPIRVDAGSRLPPRVIIIDSHNHPTIPTLQMMLYKFAWKLLRASLKAVWRGSKWAIGPIVTMINGMGWRVRINLTVHLNVANGSGDVVDRSFGPIRFEFPRGVEAIRVEGADQSFADFRRELDVVPFPSSTVPIVTILHSPHDSELTANHASVPTRVSPINPTTPKPEICYFTFTPGSNEFSFACDGIRSVPARTACMRAPLHIEGFGSSLKDTLDNPAASVTEAEEVLPDTPRDDEACRVLRWCILCIGLPLEKSQAAAGLIFAMACPKSTIASSVVLREFSPMMPPSNSTALETIPEKRIAIWLEDISLRADFCVVDDYLR
ncbi:hypothetical protein EDB85DRAFT_1899743 [Lactarius pseudohatsudake]|nr:hypothetical protein EDB85DRAFT_1899743 [Lactarius pseudohatsudake]